MTANQGTNATDGSVAVLLGNGNGSFVAPTNYNSGIFPFAPIAGDFNLTEGAPDIVVTNFDGVPNAAITLATNNSAVGTSDFAVTRFNTDGSIDTSFGVGGKVNIGFNLGGTNEDRAFSVAVQPDGKVVVAGYAQVSAVDFDFAVARLLPNGTMDTTFGDRTGRFVFGFNLNPNGSNIAFATSTTMAILPDNGIIIGGAVQITGASEGLGDFHLAVAKVTASGALDANFGSGPGPVGTLVYPSLGLQALTRENDSVDGIVVQSDGKIVISGFAGGPNSSTNFIMASRINAIGTIDTTFSPSGANSPIPGVFVIGLNLNPGGQNNDQGTSVALQSDGRIVVGGLPRRPIRFPTCRRIVRFVVLRLRRRDTRLELQLHRPDTRSR